MSESFNLLKESLEEAVEFHKGTKKLRKTTLNKLQTPGDYNARSIKNLRSKLNLSQGSLAEILFVSVRTIQSWEAGLRHPSSSALRLLQILDGKCTAFAFDKNYAIG